MTRDERDERYVNPFFHIPFHYKPFWGRKKSPEQRIKAFLEMKAEYGYTKEDVLGDGLECPKCGATALYQVALGGGGSQQTDVTHHGFCVGCGTHFMRSTDSTQGIPDFRVRRRPST